MLGAVDSKKTGHQIQIKGRHPDSAQVLAAKVANIQNCLITAFDIQFIRELKAIDSSIPVGWLVKPNQERGDEGGVDLTANLLEEASSVAAYTSTEVEEIISAAKEAKVDTLLLCAPRIGSIGVVENVRRAGFGVGAWGVATNLDLARKLIGFGIDRFTIDNPEQMS